MSTDLRRAAPYAVVLAVGFLVVPLLVDAVTTSTSQRTAQLVWLFFGLPVLTLACGFVAGYRDGVSMPLVVFAVLLFVVALPFFYTADALPFALVFGVTTFAGQWAGRTRARGRARTP